ncbi:lactadherin-like isoform X3 [Syngnathus typhle]|uniref:lactadherin-like isoform X3 n=1 Tax=Syngnathus typhle TaxID=161592 RepID=UPI002A699DC4|nr:lactadherin-like isoform X3 [Syngnathus typhle]
MAWWWGNLTSTMAELMTIIWYLWTLRTRMVDYSGVQYGKQRLAGRTSISEDCSVEGILPCYREMCNSQQRCHIELLKDQSCPATYKYLQMVSSCEQKVCLDSLGIADGSVADSSFKASSMKDATPEKARLNRESCWKPSRNSVGSWILVNLGYKRKVTAIVTQGCNSNNTRSWDIKLDMRLSVDRRKWTKHPDGKFIGGGTHLLETPAITQYVSILPLENCPEFGLRFDILGCAHEGSTVRPGVTKRNTLSSERWSTLRYGIA